MCNFFSALVKYRGDGDFDLLHKLGTPEHTDSHSELAKLFKINEDKVAKVEYSPEGKFTLDEPRKPHWWDDDLEVRVIDQMHKTLTVWQQSGLTTDGRPLEDVPEDGIWTGDLDLRNGCPRGIERLKVVKGSFISISSVFSAPVLEEAGNIYASSATTFSAPVLKEAGNIYAGSATTFSASVLEKVAGNIYARSATTFDVPEATKARRVK